MNNSASEYGGGIFGSNYIGQKKDVCLANSILWGNRAPKGSQIALNLEGTRVAIDSCDLEYGKKGIFLMTNGIVLDYSPGNIVVNPDIKNMAGMDLADDSACIDAGENEYIVAINVTEDYSGNKRVTDGNADGKSAVDIGACEFQVQNS